MYRWIYIILVPLFTFGSGYAIIEAGITDILKQHHKITTYKPVEAEVVSSEISTRFYNRNKSKVAGYEPVIEYKYRVGDKEYVSSEVTTISKSGFYRWAKAVVERYEKGRIVEAYYAPKNPSKAFLLREYYFRPYGNMLAFMPFLAIGIGMGVWTWTEWFKRREPVPHEDGWFEFLPEVSNRGKLIALGVVTILWHGVGALGCGHYFAVAGGGYGTAPIIITTIYEVAGCIPLAFLIRVWLLGRKVTDARIFIDGIGFRLGDNIVVRSEQTISGGVEVRQSSLALICQKGMWSRSGRRWNVTKLHQERVDGATDVHNREKIILRTLNTFTLPVDGEPSSPKNEGSPRYKWYIEVLTQISGGPEYKGRFPIVVGR
jgi:hypothetical protein